MNKKIQERDFRYALRRFEKAAQEIAFINSEWPAQTRKQARQRYRTMRNALINAAGFRGYR